MNMKKILAVVSVLCMMGAVVPFTGNYIPEQNVITADAAATDYGVNVWFSTTDKGAEKNVIAKGKQLYLCYELKGQAGKSYTTKVTLYSPTGTSSEVVSSKLSGSGTSTSNSVGFTTNTLGEWKAVVTVTGDITDQFTVTCNVVDASVYSPSARIWFSDTGLGDTVSDDSLKVGDRLFLCYELKDKNTGDFILAGDYQIKLTINKPNDEEYTANFYSYRNYSVPSGLEISPANCYASTLLSSAGTWKGYLEISGDYNGTIGPIYYTVAETATTTETTTTTEATTTTEITTTTETATEIQNILLGDADGNQKIDILDVITLNKAVMGKETLSETSLKAIDFNQNGKPDSEEALTILKYIVGLITELS